MGDVWVDLFLEGSIKNGSPTGYPFVASLIMKSMKGCRKTDVYVDNKGKTVRVFNPASVLTFHDAILSYDATERTQENLEKLLSKNITTNGYIKVCLRTAPRNNGEEPHLTDGLGPIRCQVSAVGQISGRRRLELLLDEIR